MYRLFIILILCIAHPEFSHAQKSTLNKSKSTTVSIVAKNKNSPLEDSAFVSSLTKLYGDSIKARLAIFNTTKLTGGEFSSALTKISFPLKPLGWTSDYDHVFTAEQIIKLDSVIGQFEKETSTEIAIVTIDSSWTSKEHFDEFMIKMFNDWGIGKKELNNGILIGICVGLKKIRITNGYGIEARLSNNDTKNIIDNIIIPEYKMNSYFTGTINGLLSIMQKVR
jgi:hypothetical protein